MNRDLGTCGTLTKDPIFLSVKSQKKRKMDQKYI